MDEERQGIVDGGEIQTIGITQWFESTDEAHKTIKRFEKETGTKFIKLFRHKYDMFKSRIRWDETTRIPYIITASGKLECQFGKDRDACRKEERKKQSLDNMLRGLEPNRKRPPMSRRSKKKNCQATISISEVLKFPQFQIDSFAKSKRSTTSKQLREVINCESETLDQEYGCCVVFPSNQAHSGHVVGETQQVVVLDERVKQKLNSLASSGVSSVKELKKHLRVYVFDQLYKDEEPPPLHNRSIFPTAKDIRDYFCQALIEVEMEDCETVSNEDAEGHCELWASQISDILDQIESSLEEIQSEDRLWQIKDRLHSVLKGLSKSRHSTAATSLFDNFPSVIKRKFPESVFDHLSHKRFKNQGQTQQQPITQIEITQMPLP